MINLCQLLKLRYSCLEQSSKAPEVFEPLKLDCNWKNVYIYMAFQQISVFQTINFYMGKKHSLTLYVVQLYNKKSAESDVAPAGIKSYKFLFVLKKNLFCSIQEIDRLEKWTK